VDWLLGRLVSLARRRGRAGEPLWLAVAGAAWLVRRARSDRGTVLWSGRLAAGERLVLDMTEGAQGGSKRSGTGGE